MFLISTAGDRGCVERLTSGGFFFFFFFFLWRALGGWRCGYHISTCLKTALFS